MKTLLLIAALASPAFAEDKSDVRVTLQGVTTVGDVLAFAQAALGTNVELGMSGGRPGPLCPVTVIAPAVLTAAEANQLVLAVLDKMKLTVVPWGKSLRIVRTERTPLVLPAVYVRCTPVTLEFPVRVSP